MLTRYDREAVPSPKAAAVKAMVGMNTGRITGSIRMENRPLCTLAPTSSEAISVPAAAMPQMPAASVHSSRPSKAALPFMKIRNSGVMKTARISRINAV